MDGVYAVSSDESQLHFEVDGTSLGEVMAHVSTFGIYSLVSQPPTLEELFMREYGENLSEADEEVPA